jgi:hypothetical protein
VGNRKKVERFVDEEEERTVDGSNAAHAGFLRVEDLTVKAE